MDCAYAYCDLCGEGAIVADAHGGMRCRNGCDLSNARECGCGGYYQGPEDRCSACRDMEDERLLAGLD
jgi:hypothetical protein